MKQRDVTQLPRWTRLARHRPAPRCQATPRFRANPGDSRSPILPSSCPRWPSDTLSQPRHHDDRRRWLHDRGTAPHDLHCRPSGGSYRVNVSSGLLLRTSTLNRKQSPARGDQRKAPARQPAQWRDRPSRHHVIAAELITYLWVLGTTAIHRDRKTKHRDHLLKPHHPPGHRLQQDDRQVRSGERKRYSWQTRAGAYVEHPTVFRHELAKHGGVEQVALPQPIRLAGPDESSGNSRLGEQRSVSLRERVPSTEHRLSSYLDGRDRQAFHVKRRPVARRRPTSDRHRSDGREHHDAALRLLALTLALHTIHFCHRVMHDLPLKGGHRLQPDLVTAVAYPLGG